MKNISNVNNEKEISSKISQLSGEEYLQILGIAESFIENGVSENSPRLVIFMGGIGTGKTTLRRKNFATGYVNFDFGEIYIALEKAFGKKHLRITEYTAVASDIILRESLTKKKNIVIEIIGETEAMISPVIDAMTKEGYKVSIEGLVGDIAECRERHLKATKEDLDYISSFYTQEPTLSFFFSYFGLGYIPVSSVQ